MLVLILSNYNFSRHVGPFKTLGDVDVFLKRIRRKVGIKEFSKAHRTPTPEDEIFKFTDYQIFSLEDSSDPKMMGSQLLVEK